MPLKLKKVGKDTLVIVSLKEEAFEALKYGSAAIYEEKTNKQVFVLCEGEPSLKEYAVSVDSKECIVETLKNVKDVEELKKSLATVNGYLKSAEKLAVKEYDALKKAADEIKVEGDEVNA